MGNILLLTQGTGGDLFPFLAIGVELKTHGHIVTVLCPAKFQYVVDQAGLNFAPTNGLGPFNEWLNRNPLLKKTSVEAAFQQHQALSNILIVNRIINRYREGDTVLIGHSDLYLPAQMAAEKKGIPYIPVFIAPYFMISISLTEEKYNDYAMQLNRMRAEIGLPPVWDWQEWLRRPALSIGLWPEWFASPTPAWLRGLKSVGFVSYDDIEMGDIPREVKEELQGDELPILITHGTSMPAKAEFFSASASACERLGKRGLIVTEYDEVVPAPLSKKVKRYKYVPFGTVMRHMSVIIHHGGMGTTARSLASGVPQLILADKYDRPDNGSRVEEIGVGEYLSPPRWQPDIVADSLRRLIESEEVHKRCKTISNLAGDDGAAARACSIIEKLF